MYLLENEVDGATVVLMDTIGKIATTIPKLKYQLAFLKEREVLMKTIADSSMESMDSLSVPLSISTESASFVQAILDDDDDATVDASFNEGKNNNPFPDEYIIPPLPSSLVKDIENRDLKKFGPHFSNRQVLIDAIVHDLTDKHKLL